MCSIRPQDRISVGELRAGLNLNSTRECLLDRLQCFGNLERMEKRA